jgi:hypothetical protein
VCAIAFSPLELLDPDPLLARDACAVLADMRLPLHLGGQPRVRRPQPVELGEEVPVGFILPFERGVGRSLVLIGRQQDQASQFHAANPLSKWVSMKLWSTETAGALWFNFLTFVTKDVGSPDSWRTRLDHFTLSERSSQNEGLARPIKAAARPCGRPRNRPQIHPGEPPCRGRRFLRSDADSI